MKRLATICIILILSILAAGFSLPARNPDDFTGKWYSAADQTLYLFHEGLIHCSKNAVATSDSTAISGAYTCSQKSILLFAVGIDGLEREKELYLVQKGEGSFLCENPDGSGTIYFIRYNA